MNKNRIQWKGGVGGSLRIIINSAEKISIDEPEQLLTLIGLDPESSAIVEFNSLESETLGVAALFLAIRSIPSYERGRVLDSAVSIIGGFNESMIGYSFSPLFSLDNDILYPFRRGCEKIANYLRPIQTDAQYTLKLAAFDFLQNQLSNASGKNGSEC